MLLVVLWCIVQKNYVYCELTNYRSQQWELVVHELLNNKWYKIISAIHGC